MRCGPWNTSQYLRQIYDLTSSSDGRKNNRIFKKMAWLGPLGLVPRTLELKIYFQIQALYWDFGNGYLSCIIIL